MFSGSHKTLDSLSLHVCSGVFLVLSFHIYSPESEIKQHTSKTSGCFASFYAKYFVLVLVLLILEYIFSQDTFDT